MKNVKDLSEEDKKVIREMYNIESIVISEGIGEDIKKLRFKNIAKGVKGFWGGHGYNYFSALQSIRKTISKMLRNHVQSKEFVSMLEEINKHAAAENMTDDQKNNINVIVKGIDTRYKELTSYLIAVNNSLTSKLD